MKSYFWHHKYLITAALFAAGLWLVPAVRKF